MIKKLFFFCAACLLCSLSFPGAVHAQEEQPAWWSNLDCKEEEQRFSGIQYCRGRSPYEHIRVIVVQLESPGLRVEYLLPDGIDGKGNDGECKDVNTTLKHPELGCDDPHNRSWYPVMSLEQAVSRASRQPDLAVVINGDYSACTNGPSTDCPLTKDGLPYYREHGPEGLTVVRGTRLDGSRNGDGDRNLVERPYLVLSQSSPLRAELHRSNSDNGFKPYDWIYTGVGGAPWLVQNGDVSTHSIAICEYADGSCYDGASQTAVGLTLDKKWMFFVLAVRADTLLSVAEFMDKELDVWQAIKFDGGGSSQLYYGGAVEPLVEDGDGRLLTNFLAIYARPGSGISVDAPPELPPDSTETPSEESDLTWWQEIQKGWTDFWNGAGSWWQERQTSFTEWLEGVEAWWRNLPSNIAEWLLQQFINWVSRTINQLCGTSGLIPIALALVVCSKKRIGNR